MARQAGQCQGQIWHEFCQPLLHGLGCNFGEWQRFPLVVHCLADLQSVHRFCCYDNIASNAICQRVLVLALCLVCFLMAVWSKLVMVLPTSTVTLHEAHLHLRWVTISRYNVLVCNQPPRPTQPPTPAGWLDEVQ